MGNVQPIRHETHARSPERETLAIAIKRINDATDRLARINAASEGTFVSTAMDAVEQAEQTLFKARERESRRLVAELIGDAGDNGPGVERAEWMLDEARADLERARSTRAALDDQRGQAESAVGRAEIALRDAVQRVIRSEGGADNLLAGLEDARREIARLYEVLTFLDARNCLPRYWDSVHPFPKTNADQPWREALAALESDPDAPLPK